MKGKELPKPSLIPEFNPRGQSTLQQTIISSLEKKYPGHEFAIFGKHLYIDDNNISFNYNDASSEEILSKISKKIKRFI